MDIPSLSTATALAKLKTKNQSGTDPAAQAFQKADKRIQQQRDSVSVQLSSFGKLQSSVAETQAAARSLGEIKPSSGDAEVKKAANAFVAAFNSAVQTAKSATAKQGTTVDSGRARAVENDLRRTISTDAATKSDLKQIGISQEKDGTLAIDAKKFDAALKADPIKTRAALAEIGQELDRTSTRELADNGNIGNSVKVLSQQARRLENQLSDQQAQAAAAQQTVTAQSTRLDNTLNAGAAAYRRIFSI